MFSKDAARFLNVTQSRIRQMCGKEQSLPAKKLGRDWWIEDDVLNAFAKLPRKPGRKAKAS